MKSLFISFQLFRSKFCLLLGGVCKVKVRGERSCEVKSSLHEQIAKTVTIFNNESLLSDARSACHLNFPICVLPSVSNAALTFH